jgi:hypothetical protein
VLTRTIACTLVACTLAGQGCHRADRSPALEPGARSLLDAHNCYPTDGHWADRIDRALGSGTPLAIEQDLVWRCAGPGRSECASVVSHGPPLTGAEPTLEAYFFERIRPLMEQALAADERSRWPLVTLNLDFKTEEPEHLAAVWALLGRYERWLTTARRTRSDADIAPLSAGPLLVLTGESDAQAAAFHDRVPAGSALRLFGAVHVAGLPDTAPAADLEPDSEPPPHVSPGPRTNYRRWWNNSWRVVEWPGQARAGEWTPTDETRLRALVREAHERSLWIRFYTLDGFTPEADRGWFATYNFGSLDATSTRWRAALDAGVDFIATDQYEAFAATRAGRGASAGRGAHRVID